MRRYSVDVTLSLFLHCYIAILYIVLGVYITNKRTNRSINQATSCLITKESFGLGLGDSDSWIFTHWTNPWGYIGSDRLLVLILTHKDGPV